VTHIIYSDKQVQKYATGDLIMQLPFTIEQFLNVFRVYNQTIFPMQILTYILGIEAILLSFKKFMVSDRFVSAILGFFWLFMGIFYHILFFSSINKGAYGFAVIFILQGLVFLYNGVLKNKLSFRYHTNVYTITGSIFIFYALIIYPLLGYLFGHTYPQSPVFGVAPCPTTIFTFGLLLWTTKKVPFYVWILPLFWSIIGFSAAVNLGVKEDFGLFAAGIVGSLLLWGKDRRKTQPQPA
jgi:hypothetical protein